MPSIIKFKESNAQLLIKFHIYIYIYIYIHKKKFYLLDLLRSVFSLLARHFTKRQRLGKFTSLTSNDHQDVQ
jgi:hypothetical protein